MSSKKEEERNEKIIRGLLKLPPNRNCINCNSLGPQYVCTNFWTFVCTICSGIHREFTHRVKSVSMSKFTLKEVEALQKGGNQRAREIFLKDWDLQRMMLPDNSNTEKIREFIKHVYVDKKFAEGTSTESLKNHEDHRRSRSYHSYSQSPVYDNQYDERRNGKKYGMLTRKPGSDRGYEVKISSILHSPDQLLKQMHEEKYTDKMAVAVSPLKFGRNSPNFLDDQDAKSNVHQDLNGIPRMLRTTSSSNSIGSFAREPISLRSVNSANFTDTSTEYRHLSRTRSAEIPAAASLIRSSSTSIYLAPTVDLFTEITPQPSSANSVSQKLSKDRVSENDQWATFDTPNHAEYATLPNDIHPFVSAPWHVSPNEASQPWNAFGDDTESSNHSLFQHNAPFSNPYAEIKVKEVFVENGFGTSVVPSVNTAWEQKSTNPFELPYSSKLESDYEFFDMNDLRAALPNPYTSIGLPGGFPEPWIPQNSTTPFISPGLTYIAGQLPGQQLMNIHSQAPVASVGGNPFA
ncbi:probable ADP-ribosylation factor GTPase-activating protein AGD14 isoform X3 [Dioscorea cayenensis subsp. rotundata]|nr:probable ADP-ribosylation factor GTPase-activating protein AGD14 isoform X3 [Dioscorea cayenensis subsp. rotundata]